MPVLIDHSIVFYDNNTAHVTATSVFSGKTHTMLMDLTQDQYNAWRESGDYIQRALPDLSNAQREFLLTGATPEEWDAAFSDED